MELQRSHHQKLLKSFDTERVVQDILSSFEGVKSKPIGQNNPDLKQRRVWSFFPCFKRERVVQDILSSFEGVKSKSNPVLKQRRVWSFVPCFERSDDELMDLKFDGSPTSYSESYKHVKKAAGTELESRVNYNNLAVMKHCMAPSSQSDSHQPHKYLEYRVSALQEIQGPIQATSDKTHFEEKEGKKSGIIKLYIPSKLTVKNKGRGGHHLKKNARTH